MCVCVCVTAEHAFQNLSLIWIIKKNEYIFCANIECVCDNNDCITPIFIVRRPKKKIQLNALLPFLHPMAAHCVGIIRFTVFESQNWRWIYDSFALWLTNSLHLNMTEWWTTFKVLFYCSIVYVNCYWKNSSLRSRTWKMRVYSSIRCVCVWVCASSCVSPCRISSQKHKRN